MNAVNLENQPLNVAVIGAGYWGPNLIRNFTTCAATRVAAVCDANAARLAQVTRGYPLAAQCTSIEQLLDGSVALDAVAIATPVSTHFDLAKKCLEAGLHVMIEKPLAASSTEAAALVEIARRQNRVLMIDHTYLFHPAVRKIHEIVSSGQLGDIYCVDSIRINLGLFQHDVNVIWDLAPHDLSIIQHVLGTDRAPLTLAANGCAHANHEIEDIAYMHIDYGRGTMASVHVNWLSPVKVRQLMFVGSKKSLIFNELNATEPLKVFDRGIELAESSGEEKRRLMISYRSGDIWSPRVDAAEALQTAVSHFAHCINTGESPISDGVLGLRVVEQLEAANRSMRSLGRRVVLREEAPSVSGVGVSPAHSAAQPHL